MVLVRGLQAPQELDQPAAERARRWAIRGAHRAARRAPLARPLSEEAPHLASPVPDDLTRPEQPVLCQRAMVAPHRLRCYRHRRHSHRWRAPPSVGCCSRPPPYRHLKQRTRVAPLPPSEASVSPRRQRAERRRLHLAVVADAAAPPHRTLRHAHRRRERPPPPPPATSSEGRSSR